MGVHLMGVHLSDESLHVSSRRPTHAPFLVLGTLGDNTAQQHGPTSSPPISCQRKLT